MRPTSSSSPPRLLLFPVIPLFVSMVILPTGRSRTRPTGGSWPLVRGPVQLQAGLPCGALAGEPRSQPSMKEVVETLEQIESMKSRAREARGGGGGGPALRGAGGVRNPRRHERSLGEVRPRQLGDAGGARGWRRFDGCEAGGGVGPCWQDIRADGLDIFAQRRLFDTRRG